MTSKVRTFRAPSPREALAEIKRTLGPGAVILGTRNIAPPLRTLSRRSWVEVTAGPPSMASTAPRLGTPRPAAPNMVPAARAAQGKPDVPAALYPYYVELVQSEVGEELAGRLVREAADEAAEAGQDPGDALRDTVCRFIATMMPSDNTANASSKTPQRLAFVGPSGSGKTTTVAKLAARYKLRENRTVALLSLDMHRLGAHEQLRKYAEIIDVPFRSAQTVAEVRAALQELAGVDYLLIDTPSVGVREEARFARLATLLRAVQATGIELVLPASTTPSVLYSLARGFAPLHPQGLVLTRLDDVIGFGVLLNVIERVGLSILYLTTGQRVPEDIEDACTERIAQLVLPAERTGNISLV